MFPYSSFDSAPSPEKRRRFNLIVVVLALVACAALALQYTSYALFPASKTDTLWGLATGIILMSLLVTILWSRGARRADYDTRKPR